jgi:prepilin signal peptidase PulO-like enzyme (type II secretory pathway)
LIWWVPSCAAGGGIVGWLAAPLAACYYEAPIRWARAGISITTAAVFGALGWRFAGAAELPAFLYLGVVGVLLAFIDIAVRRLPDRFTFPSYLVGSALLGVAVLVGAPPVRLVYALIGMAVLWSLYAVQHFVLSKAIGMGDVKLSGVLGLYLGWLGHSAWWLGLLAGFVIGGVYATGIMITRRGSRTSELPFGPFMLAGALVGILAG